MNQIVDVTNIFFLQFEKNEPLVIEIRQKKTVFHVYCTTFDAMNHIIVFYLYIYVQK